MSLATSNRDGGRTSESGHLRALLKGLKAQVMTGLAVSQRGAGANMSVDVAIGDAMIPRSDGTYGHPAWADAIYNVAITTADVSNPRRDIVVMYIDYSVTPSTGVSNNTNGVVKIAVIAGTPAGSPSDPSNASIQSAVGASNPYIKLGRVRVAAGATSITNSVIDDLRLMAQGILQGGWTYDDLYTWVYASATTFTIAGVDVTAQFPKGTKIALYQSGAVKYFYVKSSTFSTNTTVTLDGSTTYALTNVPIDRPAFSYMARPQNFPYDVISEPLNWYQELARVTASGTVQDLTSPTFATKKYLRIILMVIPTSAFASGRLRVNGDTANNYSYRLEDNGNVDITGAADGFPTDTGGGDTGVVLNVLDINNATSSEKMAIIHNIGNNANGVGNIGKRREGMAKWANTAAPITQVTQHSGSANMAAGSEMIILGHD